MRVEDTGTPVQPVPGAVASVSPEARRSRAFCVGTVMVALGKVEGAGVRIPWRDEIIKTIRAAKDAVS